LSSSFFWSILSFSCLSFSTLFGFVHFSIFDGWIRFNVCFVIHFWLCSFFIFGSMLSFSCLSLSTVIGFVCFYFFGWYDRFDSCLCQSFLALFLFRFLIDVFVLMLRFV
jgi:hypothetical protein